MTYWRRSNYPVNGHADVPNDVWREFQRIRDALMDIDQNNVLPGGVANSNIVAPGSSSHGGISDVRAVGGGFTGEGAGATDTLTRADSDGVWFTSGLTPGFSVQSRGDAWWLVAVSGQFVTSTSPVGAAFAQCDLGVSVGGGSRPAAFSPGVIDATQDATGLAFCGVVKLSAGESVIDASYRVAWRGGYSGDVDVDIQNLWAVGLYR